MIYALGNCSGAHFNPAVTLAIIIAGRDKCPASEGAAYAGVQILAGICAAYTYAAMHHGTTFPLAPGPGFTFMGAACAEIVFTFVLCFVVLCVATVKEPSKDMFGLAIASCVTAGGYAIGAVSDRHGEQVRVHGCGEGAGGRIAGKVLQHTEGWGSGRRERGEFSHRRDEAALSAVDLRNQILRIAEFSDF